MGRHARRIGPGRFANDFCISCRDEEEEDTVPHMLVISSSLCHKRRKCLGTYYLDDLEELSPIDIGIVSLGALYGSKSRGIADVCGSKMGQMGPK